MDVDDAAPSHTVLLQRGEGPSATHGNLQQHSAPALDLLAESLSRNPRTRSRQKHLADASCYGNTSHLELSCQRPHQETLPPAAVHGNARALARLGRAPPRTHRLCSPAPEPSAGTSLSRLVRLPVKVDGSLGEINIASRPPSDLQKPSTWAASKSRYRQV